MAHWRITCRHGTERVGVVASSSLSCKPLICACAAASSFQSPGDQTLLKFKSALSASFVLDTPAVKSLTLFCACVFRFLQTATVAMTSGRLCQLCCAFGNQMRHTEHLRDALVTLRSRRCFSSAAEWAPLPWQRRQLTRSRDNNTSPPSPPSPLSLCLSLWLPRLLLCVDSSSLTEAARPGPGGAKGVKSPSKS